VEVKKMSNEDKKTLKSVIDAFIKRSKLRQIAVLKIKPPNLERFGVN